ncbi:MAG: ATP-grasp domain-containing protein [Chloroflexi bacterium]|mgnify:CR=1 FL=1|nr:ATP-grasp domain-containing protein [Chloroflexota bacterium]
MNSHPNAVNVLFTSAGRRVELLRVFRQAYQALELPGKIITTDIDPLAPALRLADRPYLVPRFNQPDYIPQIIEVCRREQVSLIFPLIDPDIPLLAQHRAAIEATGARLAVVSSEAAEVTRDKWLTYQFFEQLGLPTAQSWLPDECDPDQASYPLFIKPRRGSGAKNAFPALDAAQLRFFKDYVPSPIIQEFLTGPEITSDVICDLDGEVLGVVSRQRIEVRWGEVSKGVTVHHPAVIEGCVKIAQALPTVGPITVQCILRDDVPYFTEINARLGGGLPLGIAAGVDSPRWLLARAAGIPVEIPPVGSYQTGLYMTRFDESHFFTEDEREQMASHRL